MTKPDGGPAMPNTYYKPCSCGLQLAVTGHGAGMSLRDYACIKLRVPETDKDWLNELIVKSLRNEFAAVAMEDACAYINPFAAALDENRKKEVQNIVRQCYELAGEMIGEGGK